VLTALVTRWQTIALRNQIEPLEPVRATFRKLMGIHSEELHKLTAAGDPNVRAMAVFCVAFGDRREDLARVTLVCADPEPRVRAWAAYGLAERRDVSVDPNLLARLLTDPDVMVRQRACMAIQGCVRPDSPHRERFFRQLLEMVAKDEAEAVRVRVVDALGGLATKADLPALIEAAYEQEVPPAQTMLVELVRRLGGTPRSYDEGDNG
jgi:HEAT repeat protein